VTQRSFRFYYFDSSTSIATMKRSRESSSVDFTVEGSYPESKSCETSSSSASYERKEVTIDLSNSCNANKRPRTERYLQKYKKLAKQRETVDFFQHRLEILRRRRDLAYTPSGTRSPLLVQQNLDKKWQSQTQRFQSLRQKMIDSAQKRIHLKNGIQCMQQRLEQRGNGGGCALDKLQQGEETASALMDLIAGFAGIPSEDEVSDCQGLITMAFANDLR
jgi:hypothetical protein